MGAPSRSQRSTNEALDEIWSRYAESKEQHLRNELIVAYQPLVAEAACRLPGYVLSHWEADELRSFGQDGLVQAITRWSDPDTSRFEQYARRCIRGAIFDELRRLDWMPRSIRRRVVTYKSTYDSLLANLGRNPSPLEVCAVMGLTERQSTELMSELGASQLLHLEGWSAQSPETEPVVNSVAGERNGPEVEYLASSEVEALYDAMVMLGEREHTVIFLAFVGGLTQEQIGEIIGVSNT